MVRTDAIYVIGHKNPDTDSIASAMGYAWLKQTRDGDTAIAARATRPPSLSVRQVPVVNPVSGACTNEP